MGLEQFMNEAISPWMRDEGPDNDIVISSRIRLARNFKDYLFPTFRKEEELLKITDFFKKEYDNSFVKPYNNFSLKYMKDLTEVKKRVLVEKHLISPNLTKEEAGAVLMADNEQVSIMLNEEDHIRMKLYLPRLQLSTALQGAFYMDGWSGEKVRYGCDEHGGYVTSCPRDVGRGMRASVLIHLPALVFTKRIKRMIPAINQLGFVVRGMYGEGTEAFGDMFQVSNQ